MNKRTKPPLWFIPAAIGLSTAAVLLLGEAAVSALHLGNDPFPESEIAMFRDRSGELRRKFVLDPEFGIRPPVGTGMYSETGVYQGPWDPQATGANEQTAKEPVAKEPDRPRERLLFAGDSVTRRGKLIAALKQLYGDTDYEYLNAGVETFNAEQELLFYRKYNRPLKPAQIILTFHPNDFDVVPVAFLDEKDRLRVYSGDPELAPLNRFLFLHSRLYRIFAGWRIARVTRSGPELSPARITKVESALQGFEQEATGAGGRFTVLLLPVLKTPGALTPYENTARAAALEILRKNHVRFFDLMPPLEAALSENLVLSESPGDFWHPGAELARRMAQYLKAQGVLEKP